MEWRSLYLLQRPSARRLSISREGSQQQRRVGLYRNGPADSRRPPFLANMVVQRPGRSHLYCCGCLGRVFDITVSSNWNECVCASRMTCTTRSEAASAALRFLTDLVHDGFSGTVPEGRDLQEISAKARGTAETLRDIVWIINPNHDLPAAARDSDEYIARSCLGLIPISFETNITESNEGLGMEERRHLLLE